MMPAERAPRREQPEFSRRELLRGAAGLAIGAATSPLWLPETARARSISTPDSPTRRTENSPRISPADPELQKFDGINIDPEFALYWEANGKLAQQGFPLAPAFMETNPTDGKKYKTQYFERARFESHPEYPNTPVLLGLLGREQFMKKYPDRPISTDPSVYTIPSRFQEYWNTHGGLAQQGYPISEAFTETNPTNGQQYLTQYFERARFEYHPDEPDPNYKVLLGLLGREQFLAKYPNGLPSAENPGNPETVEGDGWKFFVHPEAPLLYGPKNEASRAELDKLGNVLRARGVNDKLTVAICKNRADALARFPGIDPTNFSSATFVSTGGAPIPVGEIYGRKGTVVKGPTIMYLWNKPVLELVGGNTKLNSNINGQATISIVGDGLDPAGTEFNNAVARILYPNTATVLK